MTVKTVIFVLLFTEFSFIYSIFTVISVVLAFLSPNEINDNIYIITFVLIMLIEISLYLITKNIKNINHEK